MKACLRLVGVGLCLSFMAWSVQAEDVRVVDWHVDANHVVGEVNPRVLAGFNFGNWMNMAELGSVMHENVPPATLRFPGGNVGDDQDLNEAVLNVLVANLQLLHAENTPLVIQTRVFQGRSDQVPANRPEDAAQAARWAKERHLNVAYWQIGNEPDLYAVTRGDPSWTPERYCEVFRAQAAAIKAVDPQARFAGPGVSGSVPAAANFLDRFVKQCGDVVDMLTWHIYPTDGTGSEADALTRISEPEHWLTTHQASWRDPAKNPLGYQRKIQFAMTEYGLSWFSSKSRFLSDMPGAMFAVETALRMSRAGLDAGYYFAYQGVAFHGLLDQDGYPRPTYYGFRMINDLRGHFVETRSEDPTVWLSAAREGDKLNLIVMNTNPQARKIPLNLPGWRFVNGHRFDAEIVENEAEPALIEPAGQAVLPGYSMARLAFVKAD